MGGRYNPPSKRSIDRAGKRWLEAYGETRPYRYTTHCSMISEIEAIKTAFPYSFVGIPFPGKNQIVWCFEKYEALARFKVMHVKWKEEQFDNYFN